MANQTGDDERTVHTSATGVTTMDHDVIRRWAESRGGKPAAVEGTEHGGGDVGVIRIEFPDAPNADDANLTEISWDDFFEKFDANGLALIYQEETAGGRKSNFNKLVKRETAERATATPVKTAAKKSATKKSTPKRAASVAKKAAAQKASTAKKVTPGSKTAARTRTPVAKKTAAKKASAAKKTAKKAPVAKKAVTQKTVSKKIPTARGYRGR